MGKAKREGKNGGKPPPQWVAVLVCEAHGPIIADLLGHNVRASCGECPPDHKARVAWHRYVHAPRPKGEGR